MYHCERPSTGSGRAGISMRLSTRRRTAVATATGLPRCARNDKVGTHGPRIGLPSCALNDTPSAGTYQAAACGGLLQRKSQDPITVSWPCLSIGYGRPLADLATDMPAVPIAPRCAGSGVWPMRLYQRLARCFRFPPSVGAVHGPANTYRGGVYRGKAIYGSALSTKPFHTSCNDGYLPSGFGGWDFPATPAP